MSYDISLTIDTGKQKVSVFDVNITSNVKAMYNKAFNVPYWVDAVEGKKCKDVQMAFYSASLDMLNNQEEYEKLQPSNGWGKYEDALRVLSEIAEATMLHPKCTIEICK